ncbi:MAG: helicase-associated domain-containing protein [Polyangiales bacterium]
MARPGVSYALTRLPSPVHEEMIGRLLALDPARKKPVKESERAEAIAQDREVIARAFGTLSEVERTIVAGVARETTRLELAKRLLSKHGTTEGDVEEADRALSKALLEVLERWPVVSDNGYAFRASVQLVSPMAERVAELANETHAIPRVHRGADRAVFTLPLSLALAPGMILQGARLTNGMGLHAGSSKKLAAILPQIEHHARFWVGKKAIERDETGTPSLDLERAKRTIESLVGLELIESLAGGHIDEDERKLLAIAVMADEGDMLDLLAAIDASNVPALRLERSFAVLEVEATKNTMTLAPALHRILRGGEAGNGQRSFVQPDFEVVLSASTSLADALIVGCAAELEHLGTVARLRLTKLALQKARVSGITKEMVVEALERASGKALPTNVATALAEWSGGVGLGTLRESIVMSLDGDLSQLDRAARVLEQLVVRRPEPGLFILRAIPKSKHFEQLRAIGLHVTSQIDPYRARELAAASVEPFEGIDDDERRPTPKQLVERKDLQFVDGGPRPIDVRKLLDQRRIEKLLQRSVPQAKPRDWAIPPARTLEVHDSGEDEETEESADIVAEAFATCRERFAHRRDWIVELDALEDHDATRFLQVYAPELLVGALIHAETPATLRLAVVKGAESFLESRRAPR